MAASTRTVVVLGASYGGSRAASMLSQSLPAGWRLVVIDRNSHMNHVYVFPRFSILPRHAPKGFIPYTNLLSEPRVESPKTGSTTPPSPALTSRSSSVSSERSDFFNDETTHQFIQGSIVSLSRNSVTFIRPNSRRATSLASSSASIASMATYGHFEGPEETIHFDYAVYALGSGMPDPVNVWSEHPNMPKGIVHDERQRGLGSKKCGIKWMETKAEHFKKAHSILIVGGGALGIQFATDLKSIYPEKQITLLHSRTQLMHLYPIAMHIAVMEALNKLKINVVLGERVVTWPQEPEHIDGKLKVLRTDKGRQFEAELVLPCTGQKPHTMFMAALAPSSISPTTRRIRVSPTLQVHTGPIRPASSRASTADRLATMTLEPSPPTQPHYTSSQSDSTCITPTSTVTDTNTSTTANVNATNTDPDLSHIYAIGDCADTGAIQAGHTAYWQAEVAARNILKQIEGNKEPLETYKPGPPALKVSLGLSQVVTAVGDEVKTSEDGVEDLRALAMWPMLRAENLSEHA
ncbi:hypothetical protein BCR39DRAFT_545485 [Naematelia encephala]|uniref:FAD/NAD(P)-binding domain-containing protein n=1 Tax=Naematelia encephala TaxID=71784 RepID=A0A1Y2AR86_9TREE|nr:hypothetical protein BCR39DRAFT_545485 [Naematelia encephala]